MSDTAAIRKKDVYQTDDAKMIETFTKVGQVEFNPLDETLKPEDVKEYAEQDVLYIGVIHIPLEFVGVKEIKFPIGNVSNIEEAFSAYNDLAMEAAQTAQEQHQLAVLEYKERANRKIETAPAEALNHLPDVQRIKKSPTIQL